MADLTLRQLEFFAVLPEHGTLSSAAASLHVSESALSQAITAVEARVGEQLCIRRKARGLQLTPAGQYFAERAKALVRDAEELSVGFSAGSGRLRGPVRLGCFASFASNVLPAILEGFPAEQPEVQVSVTVGTHDDLLPALDAGLLDLALVYDMLLPPGYEQRRIYGAELEAVLPPDHPLAAKEWVTLEELAEEPMILYESSPSTSNTHSVFAAAGLRPRVVAAMPQMVLVQALIGRGLGYSLLMSRPNNPARTVEGRPVAIRPIRPPVSRTTVAAIWPQQMRLSPRAEALVDFAARTLS